MRISRLRLRNWRNFRDIEVDLTDRVFIIGPNASGKSNLLDVFRFLRDIAKPSGGLQSALSQRGGLSKVRCLAARQDPRVCVEVDVIDDSQVRWTYAIEIAQQSRGYRHPILTKELVRRNGRDLINRPDGSDRKDEMRLTQTHLEQISANESFRALSKFFESIRYLHLVPQLVRHPDAFQLSGPVEDPYGRNFLEMVAKTSEGKRENRLKQIEKTVKQVIPQLNALTLKRDEVGVPHLEVTYSHWRKNAGRQREDQFSDGTLRLIGLFWALLDGDAPLLLEEPELSLHSEIVRQLPSLFFRVQKKRKRQIFVSTHSADLLSDKGISAGEVITLLPSHEGTQVKGGLEDSTAVSLLRSGLSVAEVLLPKTAPARVGQLDLFSAS